MKKLLWLCIPLLLAARLPAQSNAPARLAIIAESPDASAASDILTAELSKNSQITLLERNEIDKVYQEQGLSVGNRDYLKLGQILGADGLWVFNVTKIATQTNLAARLIAVKPGVVLANEDFSWPLADVTDWAASTANHLNLFLPKLTVLVKDAIPISVVNLRSAVSSSEAAETERQLKLLTIERLSRERQFFVLERQRMDLLSGEKELKGIENSAFWNGSYLLEGVIDQNGYSKETMIISARLTPSKGGAPLLFEVSGNRTNLSEVVSQLAIKVAALLRINTAATEWNARDEATEYFEEAKWALKWGLLSEAQSASESAWALGKQDLDCAQLRVRAYLAELSISTVNYSTFESYFGTELQSEAQSAIQAELRKHRFGEAYRICRDDSKDLLTISFAFGESAPNAINIDRAIHILELYYNFSRTHVEGQPQPGTDATGWKNSKWTNLGIEVLVAASRTLQDFAFVPESQRPVALKLAELRALARTVAEFISNTPAVRDSYFVGERIAPHDVLANTLSEQPNIFSCEVNWGGYWQEKPEEALVLYSRLMSSPAFCYIHNAFWDRDLTRPRLVGWNEEDRRKIPELWNNFVQELARSTNILLQMEAKALARADAKTDEQRQIAEADWWKIVRAHREELVGNNVELFYLGWGFGYAPETEAMDQEYWSKTLPALKASSAFPKQKQYLAEFTPYDFQTFMNLFDNLSSGVSAGWPSKQQAAELKPLLVAYKSNLVAHASGNRKFFAQSDAHWIEMTVEKRVDDILNLSNTIPRPIVPANSRVAVVASAPVSTNSSAFVTNVISVRKFLPVPLEGLKGNNISRLAIKAHHWQEGKLVLDLVYDTETDEFDKNGNWRNTRFATVPVVALLDPKAERWQVIVGPELDSMKANVFYHHTTLWHGEIFTSNGGQLSKYDDASRTWRTLELPQSDNCELFTVNGHLYTADTNSIIEILDDGNATQIVARNRRQPPVSNLDTEYLGTPILFPGRNHSLRLSTGTKVFTLNENRWQEDFALAWTPFQPEICDGGILFRDVEPTYQSVRLYLLSTEGDTSELCLFQNPSKALMATRIGRPNPNRLRNPDPLWKLPADLSLLALPAALQESNLCVLIDHSEAQDIVNERQHVITGRKILPKNGYHAELLWFSRGLPSPQHIFLKFDSTDGCPPVTGNNRSLYPMPPSAPQSWLLSANDVLIFGLENARGFVPVGGSGMSPMDCKPGVWLVALSRIEPSIAVQRQIQLADQAKALADAQKKNQALLAKYDRNHNGRIDLDEREEALDDPDFIDSQLDFIDSNHNGWLEPEELAYFDANTNKTLEPKEQAGIEIALHLLAIRLMKKFDIDQNGLLDRPEFNLLFESLADARSWGPAVSAYLPLKNHNGQLDLDDLESYLTHQLLSDLHPRTILDRPFRNNRSAKAIDDKQRLKEEVESYWNNSGKESRRRPVAVRPVATQTNATP